MSARKLAVGAAIAVSVVAFIALRAQTFVMFQGVNPLAAIAAVIVAVVGIVWLKKTAKP